MNWQDNGYLISKNKYNENSVIAEFFTENRGKVSGLIFGATSKKIKNYLLVGNNFHINFNSKNNNKLGYFNIEIFNINTPKFLEDKKKLSCLVYCMNLIKLLTVENQENHNVFNSINFFFKILEDEDWKKNFLLWELNFFKNIGYDINFKDYVSKQKINGDDFYVVKYTTNNKIIPKFLIDKNIRPLNEDDLLNGFKLVGDYLDKTILKPNNINFPSTRLDLLNYIK
mgnify:CR=1 FL=1|tara:strand:- start:218 stop:898 length:681 start_codon:yes stop_codon:yes gene_type:complete